MALGDGIRRNIKSVSATERALLRDAIIELNNRHYPGDRGDTPVGGVSFWFKQDEVHQATHVHGGAAFLTWHRELIGRFEQLLREVDSRLSLHYWDWNEDPHDLFTSDFMGSANGQAGEPLLSAGFYNPTADPYRADSAFDAAHANPFDPPRTLSRNLPSGAFSPGSSDNDIINAPDYPTMRGLLEGVHNSAHPYIGETIGNAHTAFRDPFVFLLHSNVDRLFAMWQTSPGHAERLDPDQVYGSETNDSEILEDLEPWAGGEQTRPWWPPENRQVVKNSRHISVVIPPCYDTMPNVPATVNLETPSLTFNAVPEGEKTVRSVTFSVYACEDVTFQVTTLAPQPEFETPLGTDVTVVRTAGYGTPKAHVWISFKGQTPGSSIPGSVTVHCDQTGEDFIVPITALSIERQKAAIALVLDKSNSMSWDGGDGRRRIDVLKDSATVFVDVLQEDNAVGIVAFDHDPHDVLPMTVMGAPDDPVDAGRLSARTAIDGHTHNPAGNTAIGDGVERADSLLSTVSATDYPVRAMIVLTDGQETAAKYIADVQPIIDPNDHIFAIGLGTPEEIQPAALAALAQGHLGTLDMTGILNMDDRFLLTKFYLQILAGVTNQEIVTDPEAWILPGQKHRVAFELNEADISSDVLILCDAPWAVKFTLETPDGRKIGPTGSASELKYVSAAGVAYYRFVLPNVLAGKSAHEGQWHAVLELDRAGFKKYLARFKDSKQRVAVQAHGLRYGLNVHAWSSLKMNTVLAQDSYEPGATLLVRADLREYDLPVHGRATLVANVQRPNGPMAQLAMTEVEPGVHGLSIPATTAGIYRILVHADGKTLRGTSFTREQLVTGIVWKGGDNPPPTGDTDPRTRDERLCRLLECLFGSDVLGKFLAQHRVNPKALQECLHRFCHERTARALEGPVARDGIRDDQVQPNRPKSKARSRGRKTNK
jgi:hypothetical protein